MIEVLTGLCIFVIAGGVAAIVASHTFQAASNEEFKRDIDDLRRNILSRGLGCALTMPTTPAGCGTAQGVSIAVMDNSGKVLISAPTGPASAPVYMKFGRLVARGQCLTSGSGAEFIIQVNNVANNMAVVDPLTNLLMDGTRIVGKTAPISRGWLDIFGGAPICVVP